MAKQIASGVMAMALFFCLIACGPGQQQTSLSAEELLDLGEQYLLDLDYEQALVQFLRVVEVEPMNPRGYTGAAEAYMGLGDVDSAIDILEQGYAATGDEALAELVQRLLMGGESLDFTWDGEALLEEMYAVFETEGIEEGLEAFSTLIDTIWNFSQETPTIYLSPEGRGLGVYPRTGEDGIGYFLYYGDYDGHQRSGEGLWCVARPASYDAIDWRGLDYPHRYQGEWANDLPNGYGVYRVVPDRWVREGSTQSEYGYHGNIKDGYWHGEAWFYSEDWRDGRIWGSMYIFDDGYYVTLESYVDNDGVEKFVYSEQAYQMEPDGEIRYYESGGGSEYNGNREGVPGFTEDWGSAGIA